MSSTKLFETGYFTGAKFEKRFFKSSKDVTAGIKTCFRGTKKYCTQKGRRGRNKIIVTNDADAGNCNDCCNDTCIFIIHSIEKEKIEMNLRKEWKRFLREEEGSGTVETILILVVLIGLVIIFKKQLVTLVNDIFSKITSDAKSI